MFECALAVQTMLVIRSIASATVIFKIFLNQYSVTSSTACLKGNLASSTAPSASKGGSGTLCCLLCKHLLGKQPLTGAWTRSNFFKLFAESESTQVSFQARDGSGSRRSNTSPLKNQVSLTSCFAWCQLLCRHLKVFIRCYKQSAVV